jgi:hypothetical protein
MSKQHTTNSFAKHQKNDELLLTLVELGAICKLEIQHRTHILGSITLDRHARHNFDKKKLDCMRMNSVVTTIHIIGSRQCVSRSAAAVRNTHQCITIGPESRSRNYLAFCDHNISMAIQRKKNHTTLNLLMTVCGRSLKDI